MIYPFITRYIYRDMFSYLKAESVRQHPEATVRPWAICHIVEDGLSFASALGYKYVYIYSVKFPPRQTVFHTRFLIYGLHATYAL